MQRLWAAETGGAGAPQLTHATLTEKLGGTEKIIHRHLEEALDGLPPDLTAAVLRPLISPSGTKIAWRAHDIAFWAKHPAEEIEPILQRLASGEQRILRAITPPPTEADRSTLYELFHDILAQPVLEWCSVREGEGQERERRRERRNRAVRGVALGLAALTICLVVAVAVAVNSREIAGLARPRRQRDRAAARRSRTRPAAGDGGGGAPRHRRGDAGAAASARRVARARALQDGRARPCRACGALAAPAPRAVGAVVRPLAIAPDGRAVGRHRRRPHRAVEPAQRRHGDPRGRTSASRWAWRSHPTPERLLVVGRQRAALMAPDGIERDPAAARRVLGRRDLTRRSSRRHGRRARRRDLGCPQRHPGGLTSSRLRERHLRRGSPAGSRRRRDTPVDVVALADR